MVASIFVTHIFLKTLSQIPIKFDIFYILSALILYKLKRNFKTIQKHINYAYFLINVAAYRIAVEKEKPISVIMHIFYRKRILRDFHVSCLELRIVIGSVWQLPYNVLALYSDVMNVKFRFLNFLRKRSSIVLPVSKLFLAYNTSFHQLHAASLYLDAESLSVRQWLSSIPKSKINFGLHWNPTLNAIPKTMNPLTP
jgi:hypothetical protein